MEIYMKINKKKIKLEKNEEIKSYLIRKYSLDENLYSKKFDSTFAYKKLNKKDFDTFNYYLIFLFPKKYDFNIKQYCNNFRILQNFKKINL
jgi:hypothetical protein